VAALGSLAGALLLLAAAVAAPAQAAPGDLDLTFSGDGKQTTDFGVGLSSAAATVRQPDGKIVAVGSLGSGSARNFALARYNPDGSLDTSFSGDGMQVTDIGNLNGQATGVALQADGKIVAVGGAGTGGTESDFALARYNPDGSLDASFSGDGKQTMEFGDSSGAGGVAIQGDGKIVAVGFVDTGFTVNFALARYNPDGSLDTSFSGNGKQQTGFGASDRTNAVALQGDGKIVAAGRTKGGGAAEFALARYNPNGSLDASFSGDGKQTTLVFGDAARGVALQADGKIVAVGGGGADFALARYNPNGSLDTSFSGDGKQTTDFGGDHDQAAAVALQGDGKIVAVGGALGTGGQDFALARYNPDGSLDSSFSGDGKQTTDFFGESDEATAVALQGDGKIVAVGGALGTAGQDFALARYNPDGSLDPSFSGEGKQTTNFGGGDDTAAAVALQGDGKIVAVGGAGTGDFALARYNPDGSLDPSFSGDGKQRTDFGGALGETATGVALQGDGKIVAVGYVGIDGIESDFALARYNPDGSLDTSFSGDGKQTTDFGGGDDGAAGGALQGDGKIVAVGSAGEGINAPDFALARYNPDGSLDTSFAGDGKQTTDFGGGDQATGVALQADGKIVAVGYSGAEFALARYNSDGPLDPSFSGDGKQTTDFGGGAGANGVALQADGKIVAVGAAFGGATGSDFALARYNPDGSLDPSFSADGKRRTNFGPGSDDGATGIALQGDGRIIAVGGAGASDFALARFNPDGSLDTSFSGDGKQRTNFGGFDRASGVVLQGDGGIVAVGTGLGPSQSSDFAVARYLGG